MPRKVKGEKHIKTKVFISYALLFMLIGFILYFTFTSFRQLTFSSDRLAQPNPRIGMLHDIIFSIHNAESNIRSYTLTERRSFLNAYFNNLSEINSKIDSLYKLAGNDTIFLNTIDSVNLQLLRKTQLLEQFIQVRSLDGNYVFYREAIDDIVRASSPFPTSVDSVLLPILSDTIVLADDNMDTEEISRERDNLFKRIRTFFTGDDAQERLNQERANATQPAELDVDTTLFGVVSRQIFADSVMGRYSDTARLRRQVENTMSTLFQNLYQRQDAIRLAENSILLQDKKVMDQLWVYINRLQEYEWQQAALEAQGAHTTVNSATQKILSLILASFIVLLVFTFLFVTDVNRSRFYRSMLLEQKAHAEELVKIKQRFMANISHEIRTPLNSIIGFSRQLKKQQLPPQTEAFAEAITYSSKHLLEVVNDILDFSKMEAGKIELNPVPVNLKELTNQVYLALQDMARGKGLQFSVDTSSISHPYVLADPLRIRQILINLAGNAIKFTSSGFVKISVSGKTVAGNTDKNQRVKLVVEDSGIGISQENIKKIFDEFAQLDSQTDRSFGGTGLGLAITNRLISLMGGYIDVTSQPGKGSTFMVVLFLPEAEMFEDKVVKQQAVLPASLKANVLLVDDDRLNRMLIRSLLQKNRGITLIESQLATEAIKVCHEVRYDLIITDIQMPGMSGIELAKMIRGDSNCPNQHTPILACTADFSPNTIDSSLASGINDYVLKPIDETDFALRIALLLGVETTLENQENNSGTQPDQRDGKDGINDAKNALYDLQGLKKFSGDNPVTEAGFMKAFVEETGGHIEILQDYLSGNVDKEKVLATVHKMNLMFELLNVQKALPSIKLLNGPSKKSLQPDEIRKHAGIILETSQELMNDLTRHGNIA